MTKRNDPNSDSDSFDSSDEFSQEPVKRANLNRKANANAPANAAILFATQTIRTRLERLLKNRDEVLTGDRARGIYQMRVWSRRTRAALDTFASCYPEKVFTPFAKEIKRITRALGAARDLDVTREHLVERVKPLLTKERGLALALIASLEAQSAEKLAEALPVVEATDADLLVHLDALSELAQVKPPKSDAHLLDATRFFLSESVEENAQRILAARLSMLMTFEPCLSDGTRVAELHEMRIEAKRLRYTLEIFAPLFTHETRLPLYESCITAIKGLQDHLGTLHDSDILVPLITDFLAQHLKAGYGECETGEPIVGVNCVDFLGATGLMKLCLREGEARDAAFARLQTAWTNDLKTALERLEPLCEKLTEPRKPRNPNRTHLKS